MRDNNDDGLDALFAKARSHRTDTTEKEAQFETRLMARLSERKEQAAPWFIVWRMIPAFAAIASIALACTILFNPAKTHDLLALAAYGQDETVMQSYLGGE